MFSTALRVTTNLPSSGKDRPRYESGQWNSSTIKKKRRDPFKKGMFVIRGIQTLQTACALEYGT